MNKHYSYFFRALRTALIFIAGFLSYEILKLIEEQWNRINPEYELNNLYRRKIYHFFIILICDLIILYSIETFFKVKL
jgi:hypothetical protein